VLARHPSVPYPWPRWGQATTRKQDDMFQPFINGLNGISLGLVTLGVAGGTLSFIVLGFMNFFGILDPRLGAQVKGGLIKVIITLIFFGIGAGIPAMAQAISAAAGGG